MQVIHLDPDKKVALIHVKKKGEKVSRLIDIKLPEAKAWLKKIKGKDLAITILGACDLYKGPIKADPSLSYARLMRTFRTKKRI